MSTTKDRLHPEPEALGDVIGSLGRLRSDIMAPGVLGRKEKELVALGVSVASQCDTSIAYHVHNAMEAGATREEVVEAVGVALFAAGEPATVHVVHLLDDLAG